MSIEKLKIDLNEGGEGDNKDDFFRNGEKQKSVF